MIVPLALIVAALILLGLVAVVGVHNDVTLWVMMVIHFGMIAVVVGSYISTVSDYPELRLSWYSAAMFAVVLINFFPVVMIAVRL